MFLSKINKCIGTYRYLTAQSNQCLNLDKFFYKFRNTCYHLVDQRLSFQNAEKFCESEFGGNLASITNRTEFDTVKKMLDYFNVRHIEAIFIGGIESTTRWTWTSGN